MSAVAIQSLGAFAVERCGALVGRRGWQSKKARDVLKILVSRRAHHRYRARMREIGVAPRPLPRAPALSRA
jgi:hypothetical protein